MIHRLEGTLESLDRGRAIVRCGPIAVEVLVPAGNEPSLSPRVGGAITFHTLAYLEGQGQGSSFIPRLLGFSAASDRAFFELFTTVKGIGNRKALRCLARPVGEIATAIAGRDTALLATLPEIGKRTAETIVAELAGKVDAFAMSTDAAAAAAGSPAIAAIPPAGEDAVAILLQLGEPEAIARRLVARALAADPSLDAPTAIVDAAFRFRDASASVAAPLT
ncbi:MAG: Holliday junction branch migration protein RuvA [Phycisphaerales bacterium]